MSPLSCSLGPSGGLVADKHWLTDWLACDWAGMSRAGWGCGSPGSPTAGMITQQGRKEGREIQRRNWCCHAPPARRLSTLNIYTGLTGLTGLLAGWDKWHNYAVSGGGEDTAGARVSPSHVTSYHCSLQYPALLLKVSWLSISFLLKLNLQCWYWAVRPAGALSSGHIYIISSHSTPPH